MGLRESYRIVDLLPGGLRKFAIVIESQGRLFFFDLLYRQSFIRLQRTLDPGATAFEKFAPPFVTFGLRPSRRAEETRVCVN